MNETATTRTPVPLCDARLAAHWNGVEHVRRERPRLLARATKASGVGPDDEVLGVFDTSGARWEGYQRFPRRPVCQEPFLFTVKV